METRARSNARLALLPPDPDAPSLRVDGVVTCAILKRVPNVLDRLALAEASKVFWEASKEAASLPDALDFTDGSDDARLKRHDRQLIGGDRLDRLRYILNINGVLREEWRDEPTDYLFPHLGLCGDANERSYSYDMGFLWRDMLEIADDDFQDTPSEGIEWLQKAASIGSNDAKYFLGQIYLNRYFDLRNADIEEAIKWFRMHAECGGPYLDDEHDPSDGAEQLCLIHWGREEFEDAFKWASIAFDPGGGNLDAAYVVARCYAQGLGVKKDEVKAVEHYHAVVKYETSYFFAYAALELGNAYESGKGVRKCVPTAIEYYKKVVSHDGLAVDGARDALAALGVDA